MLGGHFDACRARPLVDGRKRVAVHQQVLDGPGRDIELVGLDAVDDHGHARRAQGGGRQERGDERQNVLTVRRQLPKHVLIKGDRGGVVVRRQRILMSGGHRQLFLQSDLQAKPNREGCRADDHRGFAALEVFGPREQRVVSWRYLEREAAGLVREGLADFTGGAVDQDDQSAGDDRLRLVLRDSSHGRVRLGNA